MVYYIFRTFIAVIVSFARYGCKSVICHQTIKDHSVFFLIFDEVIYLWRYAGPSKVRNAKDVSTIIAFLFGQNVGKEPVEKVVFIIAPHFYMVQEFSELFFLLTYIP